MRLALPVLLALAGCSSSAGSTDNGPDPCQTARTPDGGIVESSNRNCAEVRPGVAPLCDAVPTPGWVFCCCRTDAGPTSWGYRTDAGE